MSHDRELAAGLVAAVEHGHEERTLEFFEWLVITGRMMVSINLTPLEQVLEYVSKTRGQEALQEWARNEAEAMADAEI